MKLYWGITKFTDDQAEFCHLLFYMNIYKTIIQNLNWKTVWTEGGQAPVG